MPLTIESPYRGLSADESVGLGVRPESERRILASFEETWNVSVPEFSERVLSVFES